MSSWWETTKKILSGRAKGSKLIVLGVFLASVGVALDIYHVTSGVVFIAFGAMAFGAGVAVYREEAEAELKKKYVKGEQK